MTSLFRPLLYSLLCCVIAAGQLPALLHVVSCHGHAHGLFEDAKLESLGACAHGCQHQLNDKHHVARLVQAEKRQGAQIEESPEAPLHDADHCAFCHSLANPVGVAWSFELPHVQECLCERAWICADHAPVKACSAIPQPRGPPVIA